MTTKPLTLKVVSIETRPAGDVVLRLANGTALIIRRLDAGRSRLALGRPPPAVDAIGHDHVLTAHKSILSYNAISF